MAENEGLTLPVVNDQTADQRSKRREEEQDGVPEHAGRMREPDREVNAGVEGAPPAAGGAKDHTDQFWDPAGLQLILSIRCALGSIGSPLVCFSSPGCLPPALPLALSLHIIQDSAMVTRSLRSIIPS